MSAADPARPSAGFVGALTVTWWAKDARGCWAQVSHQPLELRFRDATELRVELAKYARPEHWDKVQAVRADVGLTTVLQSSELEAAGRPVDFERQATRFLRTLRAAQRSRCGLGVWLRAGHC
jgi:hypothetical protein